MAVPITLTLLLCVFPSTTLGCLRFAGNMGLGIGAVMAIASFL
jgi:hypothetical protein